MYLYTFELTRYSDYNTLLQCAYLFNFMRSIQKCSQRLWPMLHTLCHQSLLNISKLHKHFFFFFFHIFFSSTSFDLHKLKTNQIEEKSCCCSKFNDLRVLYGYSSFSVCSVVPITYIYISICVCVCEYMPVICMYNYM